VEQAERAWGRGVAEPCWAPSEIRRGRGRKGGGSAKRRMSFHRKEVAVSLAQLWVSKGKTDGKALNQAPAAVFVSILCTFFVPLWTPAEAESPVSVGKKRQEKLFKPRNKADMEKSS